MADWPPTPVIDDTAPGYVSTSKILGYHQVALAAASSAWPAANKAVFIPFRVAGRVVVYKMAMGGGVTAAGNFDVGIYSRTGKRLVSSGTTAKAASTEQILDVTDTVLGPGLYYLAMSADGTNNYGLITISGTSPIHIQRTRLLGILENTSAFVLPDPVTFAASTTSLIPAIAAYFRPF